MRILYTLGICGYLLVIRLAALFNHKAALWWRGRKNWAARLSADLAQRRQPNQPTIWVHCASLGEFEQGRPLIEAIKQQQPNVFILLTFFSPSGYEIRKNYPQADLVTYLPVDLPWQAQRFLEICQPKLAIFVKYEFWFNFLQALQQQKIPIWLVAALFRPQQVFFQAWGGWFLRILRGFEHIFVQNEASAQVLQHYGVRQYTLAGDPRIDRVLQIAAEARSIPAIEAFMQDSPTLVAGSTWPADEALLAALWQNPSLCENWKLILAPHEIGAAHLEQLEQKFAGQCLRFSQFSVDSRNHCSVLIIDNIGMLSALYRYATLAYIGGGFGAGIHNTLEPMAFGLPVIFGPKYQKFTEAVINVERGGAFVVQGLGDLEQVFGSLQDRELREKAAAVVVQYLAENRGATGVILERVREM